MLSLLNRYRELLVVGALLIYPFISFLAKGTQPRQANLLDRAVLAVSSPMQSGMTWLVDGIAGGVSGYVALRGVREDNARLLEENARLRADLNAQRESAAENERLRKLLGFAETQIGPKIAAKVIGVNPVHTILSVRINRGESDGVRAGMPAATADGIVGQVVRATGGYADVALVTDPSTKIGVRVQRSRARGTAVGTGGTSNLRLDYILRTEDIRDHDQVVTAGTDGVYPPGLVVGQVVKLERREHGMFHAAELLPAVDVTKVEEMFVIPVTQPSTVQGPAGGVAP